MLSATCLSPTPPTDSTDEPENYSTSAGGFLRAVTYLMTVRIVTEANMRGKFIAYYRVSTDKQGKSGLGLEAQRKAVIDYLDGGKWDAVGPVH